MSDARGPVVGWQREGSLGAVPLSEEEGDCLVRTKAWEQDVSVWEIVRGGSAPSMWVERGGGGGGAPPIWVELL